MTTTSTINNETELLPNAFGLPAIQIPTERAPETALREALIDFDQMIMSQMHNVPSAEALHERADMQEAKGHGGFAAINHGQARLIEEDPRLWVVQHQFLHFSHHQGTLYPTGNDAFFLGQYRRAVKEAVKREAAEWSDAKQGVENLRQHGERLIRDAAE